LTYFSILVIINSFNLIDGVDGLAGSLGMMATMLFGFYFLQANMIPYAIFAFTVASSLFAFLIFNFQPAKVFMGDTGSMLIGLVNAVLVIKFLNVSSVSHPFFPIDAAPALGFATLMLPLLDTLRVFGIRIIHRRSPFSPDRNHIHHLMLDKGLSHRAIALVLPAGNLLIVGLTFWAAQLGSTVLIVSMVILFFSAIALLYYTRPRTRLFVEQIINGKAKIKQGVPLTTDSILENKS
ncbi:MAG: MraY family glycosyltransferase, partial [Chitinophagaceae bacterium]